MFSTTLWLTAFALEILLLVRAFRGNLATHYPLFYLYLSSVILRDAFLLTINYFWRDKYAYAYWYSEYLIVVLACGVVWEVYKSALSRFPGAARMARSVLAFVLVFSVTRLLVKAWNSPNWIPGKTTLETERDLRIVQIALLLGLVALLSYYAIPLQRNLKGITYGFIGFVSAAVLHLTFGAYLKSSFPNIWSYVLSLAYLIVVLLWCGTLWSYDVALETEVNPRLEADYQALASATKKQLRAAHSHLFKVVRS
jgi:hypothetical protein